MGAHTDSIIDGSEKQIKELQIKLNDFQKQNSILRANQANNKYELEALNKQVSKLKKRNRNLKTGIKDGGSSITNIVNEDNEQEISSLKEKIAKQEKKIQELKEEMKNEQDTKSQEIHALKKSLSDVKDVSS